MAEILDDRAGWWDAFAAGWLAGVRETGQKDWKRYPRPQNQPLPPSPGVTLSEARLLLVTSGGFSLATQEPFDAANVYGDYSVRALPAGADPSSLVISHDHYDHAAVLEDPGVLLPLALLRELVGEGRVGALSEVVVSFMGYQPDLTRVADETAPAVVALARQAEADAALLVPS